MAASRRATFLQAMAQLRMEADDENQTDQIDDTDDEDVVTQEADHVAPDDSSDGDEGDVPVFEESSSETDSNSSDIENTSSLITADDISYRSEPLPPRLRRRNILTEVGRPLVNPETEKDSFELFFSEEILRTVLMQTNRKTRQIRRNLRNASNYSRPFSMSELKAALAIIIRAGSDRDNFTELENLWIPCDSKPFYRAVMALQRFKFFLRAVRFDNGNTRDARKSLNKFAAVEEIWGLFQRSLLRFYICDEAITIDEQLLGYRGHIPGRTYMPSKPRKYGLKIFWACESSSAYALKGHLYGGRNPGEPPHRNLAADVVMTLTEPFFGSGRDVCTDNYFTSHSLARQLLEKNLTLLGTIRSNRREIPPLLRERQGIYESRFLFDHDNGISIVAYQSKRNKNVLLLSSSHTSTQVTADDKKKPLLIMDYNKQKGGVDTFDQNVEEFTVRRKTVRWPLLVFYNMIDVATNNSYIIMKRNGYSSTKKDFLKRLSFDLAKDHVTHRLRNSRIKSSVKSAATEVGFIGLDEPIISQSRSSTPGNPGRCSTCSKSSRSFCEVCRKCVCPRHRFLVKTSRCIDCQNS